MESNHVATKSQPTEKVFQCTGDCLKCSVAQRQYCASQHSYNTMRIVQDLQDAIDELYEKLDAIQGNEAMVFDPHKYEEETAQEGDGAEE